MTPSTPSPPDPLAAQLPHVFIDRSLGAIQLPKLLRAAGIALTTMREHYGETRAQTVADNEWIALTAQRGWIAFHKDDNIRRNEWGAAGASRWCGSSTSRWSRFDGSLWPRSPRLTVRWKAFQR
ncbi:MULTISPECIES: PIN-like domain-containing protein [Mycobacterium avium complex (MAC)]|uniref:VapC45 PIN like domain-containing protein n=1 Tax=Mycobacterium bouchedurhonense TaxID=701041 RepID=A0ABX3S4Y6_MYCBC|nr:hypothetical protein BST19_27725 [Mycobacterium bouchedurhonense]